MSRRLRRRPVSPRGTGFLTRHAPAISLPQHGPAKIVTAAGVFFHLEELHSVVRGIEALLAPDGVFVVQAIYLGGMVENTAFDQMYHEHLCYYTLRSLSALLERHGLEVFEASMVPIHGGTIEAHVARKGLRPSGRSVRALRASREREAISATSLPIGISRCECVGFARPIAGAAAGLSGSWTDVWAYGAPAKGTTLLNSFGIGPDLVQKAVEKNPMKIGLSISGVRIPIEAKWDGRPDAYLVLAWNFIDEFVLKEQEWLATGGEFIVPVPEVRYLRPDRPHEFARDGRPVWRQRVYRAQYRQAACRPGSAADRGQPALEARFRVATRSIAAGALDELGDLPPRTAIVHVAAFRYFASRFARPAGGNRRRPT